MEDICYYLGLLVSAFGLYKIYISRKGLPAGACPIDDNRPILILGISLFIISIVLGFIGDRRSK